MRMLLAPNPTSNALGSSITSFYSWTYGPFAGADLYTWSQWITPTIIGTVVVTINEATNKTYSTTVFNEEYTTNGETKILTRTDTNAAGTVTQTLGSATLAYPTPYFTVDASFTWNAILPSTPSVGTGSCCQTTTTHSPTPTHTPFLKNGSTNTADLRGWLYTLVGFDYGDAYEQLLAPELTTLWGGQSLTLPYTGCSYTTCGNATSESQAAATTVGSVGYLLATSTTTISSGASVSPAAAQSKVSSSVEVDPLANAPSTSDSPTVPQSTSPSATSSPAPATAQSAQLPSSTSQVSQSTTQSTRTSQADIPASASTSSSQATTGIPQTTSVSEGQDTGSGSDANSPTSAKSSLDVTTSNTAFGVSTTPVSAPPSQTGNPANALLSLISSLSFSQTPIAVSQGPTTSGGQVVGPSPSGSSPTVAATSSDAATTIASALVFGGITASPVVVTVAATESSANSDQGISPATQYVVAGQTLKPGSSITIRSGSATTVVALPTDTSQTYLVVGSSTSTVEQQPAAPSALVFEGITASPIAVVATTADSTSTAGLPGGSNTAGPATQYVVASQTLVPGSTITVGSGGATTVVALQTDSSQTFLIVGSSTSTIGQQQISGTPPAFTIGSSVIAANSESQYLIDSRTLVPGGSAITVSGTVISLASGATEVVIGTSIEEITSGLGGYIWSGLGAGPTASSAAVGSTSGSSSPGSMSTSAGIAVQTSAGMQAYMADNLIAVAGAVITLICLRI